MPTASRAWLQMRCLRPRKHQNRRRCFLLAPRCGWRRGPGYQRKNGRQLAGHSFYLSTYLRDRLRLCSRAGLKRLPFTPLESSYCHSFEGFLLSQVPVDFGQQGIFASLATDAQIIAVRFRRPGALQTLAHKSLIVIDRRKISVAGYVIHEQR